MLYIIGTVHINYKVCKLCREYVSDVEKRSHGGAPIRQNQQLHANFGFSNYDCLKNCLSNAVSWKQMCFCRELCFPFKGWDFAVLTFTWKNSLSFLIFESTFKNCTKRSRHCYKAFYLKLATVLLILS